MTHELNDVMKYLELNNSKLKISCIKPFNLRKDYIKLMSDLIEKSLNKLQKDFNEKYTILFIAPYIKLKV